MKYRKYLLIILFLATSLSCNHVYANDPWKDGTWKFPVIISKQIYYVNAGRLVYDLNQPKTIYVNTSSGRAIINR